MLNFRKLKIRSKFQSRTYGEVKIPEIRLEGKWLEELGFTQGRTVRIEHEQNKLIITLENGQE